MSTYVKVDLLLIHVYLDMKFVGFSISKQEIGRNNGIESYVLKYNSNENIRHKKLLGF